MKAQLERWAGRFDALATRERVLVAVCAMAVTAYAFHLALTEPLLIRRQRLVQDLAEARTTLKTVEVQLQAQQAQPDAEAARRAHRDALRKQVADLDREMQGVQKGLVPPEQMAKLLQGVLASDRGMQLGSLRKLPVQRYDAGVPRVPAAPTAAKDAKPTPGEAERSIYQHGFEITVHGSYGELYDYVARLERLPWQMFWSRLTLDAEHHPRLTLTLTVHTLSLSKAWLVV